MYNCIFFSWKTSLEHNELNIKVGKLIVIKACVFQMLTRYPQKPLILHYYTSKLHFLIQPFGSLCAPVLTAIYILLLCAKKIYIVWKKRLELSESKLLVLFHSSSFDDATSYYDVSWIEHNGIFVHSSSIYFSGGGGGHETSSIKYYLCRGDLKILKY